MIYRGMYVLKEDVILAFTNLVKNMEPYGSSPMKYTPGLWRHNTIKTTFTFYVDDLGTKYFSKDNVHHLIDAVMINYKVATNCTDSLYIGVKIYWKYTASPSYVSLVMKGFVNRAQTKSYHPIPKKPQHAPRNYLAQRSEERRAR